MSTDYVQEILTCEREAVELLSQMVVGSLEAGAMPPTQVFRWMLNHSTYLFMHTESAAINDNDKRAEEALAGGVDTLSKLLSIASKQKMFGLHTDIVRILQTRKLRYPLHMDLTYDGRLP